MSGSFADVIYFEKQTSRLCALHCVNSLLQAPTFSEYEFNKFSKDLDASERMLWKGDSKESHNADSTGYYSIGVIEKALLAVGTGFSVVNVSRPDIWKAVLSDISNEQGFVFNLRDHWLCVRRINGRWWNLDSLKDFPIPLSEADTRNFLMMTVGTGYTVFAVRGERLLPLPVVRKEKLALNQQIFTVHEIAKLTGKPVQPVQPFTPPSGRAPVAASPAALAPEPSPDVPTSQVVSLGVRLKTGQRVSRKFNLKENTVSQVWDWARSLEAGVTGMWRVGPPRVQVELGEAVLETAGFKEGMEMVILQ